jgi:hypothetical protein
LTEKIFRDIIAIEVEWKMKIYLDNCCYNRPFDYTEWRRDNLWTLMTTDEILETAAKNTENYIPPAGTEII